MFGSLARRQATPASDADILIVLNRSRLPFLERSPHYALDGCGVATDLLVYTRAEMERMREEGNLFLRQVEGECCVLWRRRHHASGCA